MLGNYNLCLLSPKGLSSQTKRLTNSHNKLQQNAPSKLTGHPLVLRDSCGRATLGGGTGSLYGSVPLLVAWKGPEPPALPTEIVPTSFMDAIHK